MFIYSCLKNLHQLERFRMKLNKIYLLRENLKFNVIKQIPAVYMRLDLVIAEK